MQLSHAVRMKQRNACTYTATNTNRERATREREREKHGKHTRMHPQTQNTTRKEKTEEVATINYLVDPGARLTPVVPVLRRFLQRRQQSDLAPQIVAHHEARPHGHHVRLQESTRQRFYRNSEYARRRLGLSRCAHRTSVELLLFHGFNQWSNGWGRGEVEGEGGLALRLSDQRARFAKRDRVEARKQGIIRTNMDTELKSSSDCTGLCVHVAFF